MARRKKPNTVHGWVILDKPHGMTSTHAVSLVKRCLGAGKAGHAGTLDPLASGMLPIALGEATKTVPYCQDGKKLYRFTVKWGEETTTDDREGPVSQTSEIRPSDEEIEQTLGAFTGTIMQRPPAFSAIKVNGERAYDLARSGEEVELPEREAQIFSLEHVERIDEHQSVFEAETGKGVYVRSLARDMAQKMGTFGHIADLRRLAVAPFTEEDMIEAGAINAFAEASEGAPPLADILAPVESALRNLPHVNVGPEGAKRIKNGQPALARGNIPLDANVPYYVTSAGILLAIANLEKGHLKPTRLFHL